MGEIQWNDVNMLKKLTGEGDEELLSLLLIRAEEKLLELTGRTKMSPKLVSAKREWALIAYNRLGMEGESSRSGQGGLSSAFIEIPEEIRESIRRSRLARVGGKTYETGGEGNEPPQDVPVGIDHLSIWTDVDGKVAVAYTGEPEEVFPSLELSLLDGNLHIDNNGNNGISFSINCGELEVND